MIGAAIGGTVGYISGKEAGLSGFDLFSYTFANGLIGAISGGAGAAVGSGVAGALSVGGFAGGFIAGAAGGAVGGFISGATSAALNTATFNTPNSVLLGGLKGGLIGGVTGGLLGGTISGIDAARNDAKFWNGMVNEIGGSTTAVNRTFLDEEIPAGAKPTATGKIATTDANPDYGKYGMTRNGGARPHRGIDYSGEVGDDVYAMYDGKVTLIGGGKDYGPHLVRTSSVINGKAYNVDYGHMSGHSVNLNQSIAASDKIGLMGRFGYANSSYPTHVHISVWRPVYINSVLFEGYVMPSWK